MTKTFGILMILALPLAGLALAMTGASAEYDANGDGVLTIDEVQAVFPDLSVETFTAMDLNADGALDEQEIAAAQEAGVMPTAPSGG